jgi:glucose-1-phosphate adenylyltransferase
MIEHDKCLDRTLTFIMAGGHGTRLHPLTEERAKPAVVFGGIYRLIDFTLSNCYHSGLRRLIVLTQYRSRSLHRHILNGWSFFNTRPGEYIDLNPPQFRARDSWYLGTADAIYQNLFTINDEKPDFVLVLAGDHIYKMNYSKFIQFHIQKNADISVCCIEFNQSKAADFGVLHVDADHRVIDFVEKPKNPPVIPGKPDKSLVSMGIYVFSTNILKSVFKDEGEKEDKVDFGRNVIPYMIKKKMRVFAYPFEDENKKEEPYWRDVGDIDAYYEANMELVDVDPLFNLYDRNWPIMTWYPTAPPAKTVFADEKGANIRVGKALDSLLSPGCIISGGIVKRSVISPYVKVNSYCEIEDSIIMHGCNIGREAKIKKAILDKNVKLPPGYTIGYDLEADRKRFSISDEGVVVVPKNWSL